MAEGETRVVTALPAPRSWLRPGGYGGPGGRLTANPEGKRAARSVPVASARTGLAEARGRTLREAVLEAGAVRFRPIALTAAAVVVGGLVMVLDPIFQGLAVALISGAIVATMLTMVVVPLLYWELQRRSHVLTTPEHSYEDAEPAETFF